MKKLIFVILTLLFCASVAFAWAPGQDLPTRAGTVQHALTQADGTTVTLDCVTLSKICAEQAPAYLVAQDPWTGSGKVIVMFYPSTAMRLGMVAEVVGTMGTAYGQRIVNAASVKAYLNDDASINYGYISKPDNEPLSWAYGKQSLAGTNPPTSPSVTPDSSNLPTATYYSNIADVKSNTADLAWVWLANKAIVATGTDATYGNWFSIAADGSNDTLKCYAPNPDISTLDRCYSVCGLMGTQNGVRCLSTTTGPNVNYWICNPSVYFFDAGKIAWAKAQPDGSSVSLPQKTVSAVFQGYYYICEDQRVPGVKVASNRVVAVGNVVNISNATITTINNERTLINVSASVSPNLQRNIQPLGMNNRSLGGANWQVGEDGSTQGQVGVSGGVGLSTIGLLVRIWGTVTYIDTQRRWYVIDDGTGLSWTDGGTSYTGVKVLLGDNTVIPFADSQGTLYQIGDYVAGVNGVSSCAVIDDVLNRVLRQVGEFGKSAPGWFPANKINRATSTGE